MINFKVDNLIERRNDNPDLLAYRVHLDDKQYVMCYDKDELKEVYFINRFKNYFMSCRSDMKTISHYYIDKTNPDNKVMRRYENGVHNRTYLMKTSRLITCTVDGQERIYTTTEETITIDPQKFYNDLTVFLSKFNTLKLYELFAPNELI